MEYNWDYLYSKAYNNRTGRYKSSTQLEFILRHVKNNSTQILDVAGGSGRFAIPLSAHAKDVTVVDINESAIKILEKRASTINAICADFLQTDLRGGYTSILCIEAMCYFPDLRQVFKKMNSLLDLDGNVIFTYTNISSWRYALRKLKGWITGEKLYYDVQVTELKNILNECNFVIETVEGMNWIPLPLTSNSILVDLFIFIEKTFNLKKWPSQSPWLLISVKKIGDS